jgi:DNA-binding PadR family transcriptional regulator
MAERPTLSYLEQLALLAVARLGDEAYGVTVHREIEKRSGEGASIAAIYAALDRMEERGLVTTWTSAPTRQRGGRARKHFRISPAGSRAVHDARAALDRMWEGLELDPEPVS